MFFDKILDIVVFLHNAVYVIYYRFHYGPNINFKDFGVAYFQKYQSSIYSKRRILVLSGMCSPNYMDGYHPFIWERFLSYCWYQTQCMFFPHKYTNDRLEYLEFTHVSDWLNEYVGRYRWKVLYKDDIYSLHFRHRSDLMLYRLTFE